MFVHVYRLVQTCLFLSVCQMIIYPATGWRHGHGLQPTARAMAKRGEGKVKRIGGEENKRKELWRGSHDTSIGDEGKQRREDEKMRRVEHKRREGQEKRS